jgi:hypothetical protein
LTLKGSVTSIPNAKNPKKEIVIILKNPISRAVKTTLFKEL